MAFSSQFTEYNRNVVRLEPPLICERNHVDQFIEALDEVMSRGIVKIVMDFIKLQASSNFQYLQTVTGANPVTPGIPVFCKS